MKIYTYIFVLYSILHVARNNRDKVVQMVKDRLGVYYTADVILNHLDWYQRYQHLASQKRKAMQKWREQIQQQQENGYKRAPSVHPTPGFRCASKQSMDNQEEKDNFLMDTYIEQLREFNQETGNLHTDSSEPLKVQMQPKPQPSSSYSVSNDSVTIGPAPSSQLNSLRSVNIERLKRI